MPHVITKRHYDTVPSEEVTEEVHSTYRTAYNPVAYIITFLASIIEILLAFRLLLKLLGASAGSPFVQLIYNISSPLVRPFNGIFSNVSSSGTGSSSVFEPAVIVAMIVYAIIAWAIRYFTATLASSRPTETLEE